MLAQPLRDLRCSTLERYRPDTCLSTEGTGSADAADSRAPRCRYVYEVEVQAEARPPRAPACGAPIYTRGSSVSACQPHQVVLADQGGKSAGASS
jgi:hypothetical protein